MNPDMLKLAAERPDLLISKVSNAILFEQDRWSQKTENGSDPIFRSDSYDEPELVASVPEGDGPMHYWTMVPEAMARAAIEAMGITLADA